MLRRNALHAAIFGMVGLFASADVAGGGPPNDQNAKSPLALITSGGTSLGSYEAGYHYYMVEWLKQNRNRFDVKVITGTSAGSINAVLTFLALADSNPVPVPESSIFYKSWSTIDFSRLRGPDTRLGLAGRMGLEYVSRRFAPEAMRKASREVDMYLGITATHTSAYNQEIIEGLEVPTIKQNFIVRGSTRRMDDGKYHWSLCSHIDTASSVATPVLPFKSSDSIEANAATLYHLAFASTGIPGLFQPFHIKHLQIIPSKIKWNEIGGPDNPDLYDALFSRKKTYHLMEGIAVDTLWNYVDGGVLNNSPIRLAYEIAQTQSVATNGKNPYMFYYLSPENRLYPALEKSRDRNGESVIGVLGAALGDWVKAARSNELLTLKEVNPDIDSVLELTYNHYPVFSRLLGQFFGFLEQDVRLFDFYLGMYDAKKFLERDAIDSRHVHMREKIGMPDIKSVIFDSMRHAFEEAPPDSFSDNFQRLTELSRLLFLQYWKQPGSGDKQKRLCAKQFAAAINGLDPARIESLRDTLKLAYNIKPGDFNRCIRLVRSIVGERVKVNSLDQVDSVKDTSRAEKKAAGDGTERKDITLLLDSVFVFMKHFHDFIALNDQTAGNGGNRSGCIFTHLFGYKSPWCEHYLEASFIDRTVKWSAVTAEVRKKLEGISAKNEFDTVLAAMYDIGFIYSDIPNMGRYWEPDSENGRWKYKNCIFSRARQPMPLMANQAKQKIKMGFTRLLRTYNDEPGGPEPERLLVSTLGEPALGFLSAVPPTAILYTDFSINSGEAGISLCPGFSTCRVLHHFRVSGAICADSISIVDATPAAQGLSMPYLGPVYFIAGLEWEFFREPMIQVRLGAREEWSRWRRNEHRTEINATVAIADRFRIKVAAVATKWGSEELSTSIKRGLIPRLTVGYQLLTW